MDEIVTTSEHRSILAALHAMEVRFTERLAVIETETRGWRTTHDELRSDILRVEDKAQSERALMAADIRRVDEESTRGDQRLTIGLIVVGVAAAGRLGVNIAQWFV